jgi:hypothetical protein
MMIFFTTCVAVDYFYRVLTLLLASKKSSMR